MRILCARIMATVVVGSFLTPTGLAYQSRGTSRVSVSFVLPSEGVTLHEPVLLQFSIRNGLAEPIMFDLGKNRNSRFIFTIINPHGAARRVGPLSEIGFGAIGKITLAAGDTFRERLLFDLWFQFPEPGRYSLKPKLTLSVRSAAGTSIPVTNGSALLIEVKPRDPKRLEAVCDRLASAAVSPDAGRALEAVAALSYVVDPVAVPFLAKAARRDDPIRNTAVEGLARVANAYGLDVVLSALGPERVALEPDVKAALEGIRRGVTVTD